MQTVKLNHGVCWALVCFRGCLGVFQRMFGYVAVTLSACWEKPLVIECDQKLRTSETVISWLAAIRNYDLLFMMLTKNKGKKRIKTTLFLPSGMIERQALQG